MALKISYNWLQTHFTEKIPAPMSFADVFTMHSSEVEGMEIVGDDTVFDIKILPDRAHYAQSHRGIAYELSAMTGLKLVEQKKYSTAPGHDTKISVTNTIPQLCRRYIACLVEDVTAQESQALIQQSLTAIGGRSINSIVDLTNLVMFDMGQPMHAFDADKVVGGITIRMAKEAEMITLLDGRDVTLNTTMMVIADDVGPLAIAGVKGGKRAEVTTTTTRIIVEAAHFDPTSVRRTSTRLNLRNDSSKRFENEITPHFASIGMDSFLCHLETVLPQATVGPIVDIHEELPQPRIIVVSKKLIDRVLGTVIPEKDFELYLARLNIGYEMQGTDYTLSIPVERLDIVIPEDIAEEVGRLYGYNTIPAVPLSGLNFVPRVEPAYYVSEKIKNTLQDLGFSEIITHTLGMKGDVEVTYPVSKDRRMLRDTLKKSIEDGLVFNIQHAALLGLAAVSLFEIGKVFTQDTEKLMLAFGSRSVVKVKKGIPTVLEITLARLTEVFGVALPIIDQTPEVVCVDLEALIAQIAIPVAYGDTIRLDSRVRSYSKISPYPCIVRDIAVFVPATVKQSELETIIDTYAGELMVRRDLFDVFTKKNPDGVEKTSYAFRMVFQSIERTLTDAEIQTIMEKITEVMNGNSGWEVR